MKVCFYSDVKVRDLPVIKYLSKNIPRSFLLPIFKTSEVGLTYIEQNKYSPDIVVTTSFNKFRTPDIAIRASLSKSKLIEYTSEQYFSSVFDSEKLALWDKNDKYKVDYYFCWGRSYADKLINIAKVPKERIFIIGSAKVASIHNISKSFEQGGDDFILFVSDYNLADFDHAQLAMFNKEYSLSIDYSEVEVIKAERLAAIQTANDLSDKGFNVKFRVHPGEIHDVYKNNLSESVVISYADTPFLDDLLSCQLAIGYSTTSIFEIVAMGKRFISLRNFEELAVNQREFYKHVEVFTSKELLSLDNSLYESLGCGIEKKLSYYCENINDAYSVKTAFYQACKFIINITDVNNSRYPVHIYWIFYLKNFSTLIFRKLVTVSFIYKMLPSKIKGLAKKMVGSAHALTKEDYIDFYGEHRELGIINEFDFKLSEQGWIYTKSKVRSDKDFR